MQDYIKFDKKEIQEKKLFLQGKGKVFSSIANEKLRIIALFSYGQHKRYFPMDAVCQTKDEVTTFQVKRVIRLEYVFFDFLPEENQKEVVLSFLYCDALGQWHTLKEGEKLDVSYFIKEEKKTGFFKRIWNKICYVLMTFLLPVWILEGCLVVKGIIKSPYIDEEIKGKKGIFYHAHGLVKRYTGYGYSLREVKTNYFVHCYERACRKMKETKGILFLSERSMDRGGNLDLVRQGLSKRAITCHAFLDIRPIQKLPFSKIKESATLAAGAKIIVLEDFYPQLHALSIREDTKVVQLWHACGAFKMFGLSEVDKIPHLTQDTRNHRNYHVVPVSSAQMIPFYSEAFGISPQNVYPIGVARTDIFFDKTYREQVCSRLKQKYPVLKEKKMILFAPTFRGSGKTRAYYPDTMFSIDAFMEKMPEDVVLFVKHHPFVNQKVVCSSKYQERVFDFTGKENINDLLFVTSLLITDYSSSIFEAALLQIPMLFYVFDMEEYKKQRDIYFDFSTFAPGKQVMTLEELAEASADIVTGSISAEERKAKLQQFCDYFLDALDGNSTKRTIDFIMDLEKMPNS